MRYILIDEDGYYFHDKYKEKIFVTYSFSEAKRVKKKKKDKLCKKNGFKVYIEVD